MKWKVSFAALLVIAAVELGGSGIAAAQCVLPNQLSNGQVTDATAVMGNLSVLQDCTSHPPVTGPGGGVVTLQNPAATSNYNFNLPATLGNAGDVLTSSGSSTLPQTWTPTGVTGHALPFLDGSNSWSGMQVFGPVVGAVSVQSGTTYTVSASDCGTTVRFTTSSPVSFTTVNSLPSGCAIAIEQAGTGQVTTVAGAGVTHHSAHGFTKTWGQYAILGLFVDANVGGAAADIIVTGDGA